MILFSAGKFRLKSGVRPSSISFIRYYICPCYFKIVKSKFLPNKDDSKNGICRIFQPEIIQIFSTVWPPNSPVLPPKKYPQVFFFKKGIYMIHGLRHSKIARRTKMFLLNNYNINTLKRNLKSVFSTLIYFYSLRGFFSDILTLIFGS